MKERLLNHGSDGAAISRGCAAKAAQMLTVGFTLRAKCSEVATYAVPATSYRADLKEENEAGAAKAPKKTDSQRRLSVRIREERERRPERERNSTCGDSSGTVEPIEFAVVSEWICGGQGDGDSICCTDSHQFWKGASSMPSMQPRQDLQAGASKRCPHLFLLQRFEILFFI